MNRPVTPWRVVPIPSKTTPGVTYDVTIYRDGTALATSCTCPWSHYHPSLLERCKHRDAIENNFLRAGYRRGPDGVLTRTQPSESSTHAEPEPEPDRPAAARRRPRPSP